MEKVQKILGRKLGRHILSALKAEPLRYSDVQYRVTVLSKEPVHSRTLTETIRWLEQRHYIEKYHDAQADRYRLTTLGAGYVKILDDIKSMEPNPSPDE